MPLTKLGLRDFPPFTLTALRYLVAAPCFLFLLRQDLRRPTASGGVSPERHTPAGGRSGAANGVRGARRDDAPGRSGGANWRSRSVAAYARSEQLAAVSSPRGIAASGRLPPRDVLWRAGALGLLGIGVGQVSQTLGVRETTASVATVISALIPILVVVFGTMHLHQPITPRQAWGLVIAFAGVVFVATGGPRPAAVGLDAPALAGDGLMILSSLAVALYYVLSAELIARYSVVTVAALTSVAGAAALTPVAVWELGHAPARMTPVGIAVVLYLAILVTVVGILIWLRALERLPLSVAAVLQYLQPLVGVVVSAVLFGDRLGIWFAAGTALVLLGIAWSTASRPGGVPPVIMKA